MASALITSGGGAKGAFTIGALLAMRRKGIHHFDLISGTSTGSFIAALVAAGELDALQRQYLNVEPDDVLTMQNFIANLLQGRPFIFDTLPLQKLVVQHITDEIFHRIMADVSPTLCVTAVSLQSGKATVFSNRDLPVPSDNSYNVHRFRSREEMMNALLASGSQGGFTPPVRIGNEQFIDGGHRDVIPTRIVVDQGIEKVFVLSNNPAKQVPAQQQYNNILQVLLRVIAIFVQDVRENDLRILTDFLAARGQNPVVIAPEQDLDEEHPTGLRFNPGAMMAWMIEGARRADEVLGGTGPGPVFV